MTAKKILIIGNKPYINLNVNPLLDSFNNNIRINMGIPYGNNGNIRDELVFCNHISTNSKNMSWNNLVRFYSKSYKLEFLKIFYDKFNAKDYNKIYTGLDAHGKVAKYNNYLNRIGCPYNFPSNMLPRSGMSIVLEKIIQGNDNIFLFGFSIVDEVRRSYYVKDEVFKNEENGTSCHSKSDEINIIRWLHENQKIDLTLCMLQDDTKHHIQCHELTPSSVMSELLTDVFGPVTVSS